jgi:hypothetical protein
MLAAKTISNRASMLNRDTTASELSRLLNQGGPVPAIVTEPCTASEESVQEQICGAKDWLLGKLDAAEESVLFHALADTSVAVFQQRNFVSIAELVSTRRARIFDSTGDSALSTVYLGPWNRFQGMATDQLGAQIELLLRRALTESRIPANDMWIRTLADALLPIPCTNCGKQLRPLRLFRENLLRYDCGMCQRCNEALCPACFPGHLHKLRVVEKCRKCGSTGIFSQMTAKKQRFFEKLFLELPEYDLATGPCPACGGQGFREL